jgi:DNA-binding GntR family transcriptional regulator
VTPNDDDAASNTPLKYRRIASKIKGQITAGALAAGTSLPRDWRIVRLSRGAVRQAMNLLEAEGLISRGRGAVATVRQAGFVRELGRHLLANRDVTRVHRLGLCS